MLAHARALHQQGRLDEAEHAYRHALRHLPGDAAIHNDHGTALAALGRLADAVHAFDAACNLEPQFATALSNRGSALMGERRMQEAVASLRRAVAADPTLAAAHANLGNALLELLHPADAMPHLDRALALDPALAESHYARGQALLLLGDLSAAEAAFAAAVALQPGQGRFYDGLTAIKLLARDDVDVRAMEALVAGDAHRDDPARIGLHFGLHRAYEQQGRYEEAFTHLARGNALRRARIAYDEVHALGAMAEMSRAFDGKRMQDAPPRGGGADVPIFIVGMPRSGSTLVEQIVCSHAQVFGAGEIGLLANEAGQVPGGFPAGVAGLDRRALAALGDTYRARLRAMSPGAPRIIDKRLTNFMQLGLIRLALPEARVIHTVRDAADTCLSCFAQTFTRWMPFTNELGELGRYYRGYAGLMAHWRRVIEPGFVLDVRYEALVDDFEPQVRRILAFCGLPWDPALPGVPQTRRPVLTASAAQVRRTLYRSSIGRARPYGGLLQPLHDALDGIGRT